MWVHQTGPAMASGPMVQSKESVPLNRNVPVEFQMTLNSIWSQTPDRIHSIPSFEFRKTPPPGPDYGIQNLSLRLRSLYHCTYFVPYILRSSSLFSFYLLFFIHFFQLHHRHLTNTCNFIRIIIK
jgi:hypothetical protein